jgi:HSP20 family protein
MDDVRDRFRDLRAEMETFLDDLFVLRHPFSLSHRKKWVPAVDVYETDELIVITAELAGVTRDDLRISVAKNGVYLSGIRREARGHLRRQYHSMEIRFGPFEKLVPLPSEVRPEAMEVQYENGLLEITLPKLTRPKEIIVEIE